MKLKILLLSAAALVSAPAFAGGGLLGLGLLDWGIKAGVSTQRLHVYDGTTGAYTLQTDNKPAFQIGGLVRINTGTIHIQPEILYTMNRYRLNTAIHGSGEVSESKVKYNTLDVPVMVGMRFLILRFQAGPVFTIMNKTNTSLVSGSNYPLDITTTKPIVSYAIGIGLDLFKLNFDVRYNGRFAKGDQSIKVGQYQAEDFNTRMRGWSFTLAYLF